MKHAILIMAHKNYSFLHHLIEYFERDCYVFVHIDKKSEITKQEIACLREMPQVTGVYQKYSVHWGGFSILKAQLFLLRQAYRNSNADYYHVISGQDYPIKPLDVFLNFFGNKFGFSFVSYVHLPHPRWQKNTYERFVYYYPYDIIDRNASKRRMWIKKVVDYQKRLEIKRRIPQHFEHLYGGSQWFSLHKNAMNIFIRHSKQTRRFYNRLRWTFAPEETFFTSVLVNTMPSGMVINNNYRYIRWKLENGNIPANLGEEHFDQLAITSDFFARKMELPYCEELIKHIDTYLLHDSKIEIMSNGGWNYKGFSHYKYSEELTRFVFDYAKKLSIHNILDCGCGAGFYVAALRKMGLNVNGIDANPYTEELSTLLIKKGEEPCTTIDLTCPKCLCKQYEFVLCIDVLPYIPENRREMVIGNLDRFTKKSLLLGWDDSFMYGKETIEYFYNRGFRNNDYLKTLLDGLSSVCSHFYMLERDYSLYT